LLPSVEAMERSFAERVSLNRAILSKRYWYLPVDDVGHGEFMPVGRGIVSSPLCAKWVSVSVCFNVELHEGKVINGVDYTGKVIVRNNHLWCNKSSCPACFIRGWSVRQGRSITSRLDTAVKRGFGEVEHIIVSPSVVDRCLPESVMRKKCRDALKDRGVIGGEMTFHGFRINKERDALVFSPHYHFLGFVEGKNGFDRCRACVHKREDCGSCDGFKGREVRGFKKDGYLVKVERKRKTVFGTAWYQLNHATIRVGIKQFHVVTWFGSCANLKFKSEMSKADIVCPVCSSDMVKSMHMGKRFIIKDIGHCDYVSWFGDDEFDEDGNPNYVAVVGSRGG